MGVRYTFLTTLGLVCGVFGMAHAETELLQFSGEIQAAAMAGGKNDHTVAQGEFARALGTVTYGPWEANVAYLWYPLESYGSMDATNLSYRFNNNRLRAGRILPVLGQSSWSDQWNTGFVLLPEVEEWIYFGELSIWQTSPAVEFQTMQGNATFTLTRLQNDAYDTNQIMPVRLDSQAFRAQTYYKKMVLGAGYWTDLRDEGHKIGQH
jgi:hypothetical protein